MQYLITFLEGIISFISPCMLPMLPIYISYFAGNAGKKQKTLINAISFVIGFSLVFILLGLFAGTIGSILNQHKVLVNIVSGVIIIILGLSYMDILHLHIFKGIKNGKKVDGIISAFVFGVIYSLSLTPCVGAFLGSALMLASSSGSAVEGGILLFFYSLGLGIPFIISALLLDKLNNAILFIKKHYKIINIVCGIFLIIIGVLMLFGIFNKIIGIFS